MFEIYFDQYSLPYESIPIGHQGENEARCLIWDVTEYIDKFGRGGVQVKVTQPETGDVYWAPYANLVGNEARWTISNIDTAKAGTGMCELYYTDASGNVLAKSDVARTWVLPTQGDTGSTPSPYEDLLDTIAEYASTAQSASNSASASAARAQTSADYATKVVDEKVGDEAYIRATNDAGLQGQINSLMGAVGSPLVAPLASVMSDTDRIYVYTGNESGYTNGNWYYYNGTAWVSGGVYNSTALETDKTLTASDMAADAKVTGDRIGAVLDTFKVGKSYGEEIVTFDDGVAGSPLKDFVVNIRHVQSGSGDPSPSNVRAISGWTGANVTRCGKNLWDANAIVTSSNHTSYVYVSDGYLRFSTGNPSYVNLRWENLNFTAPLSFSGTVKNFGTSANNIRIETWYEDGTYTRYSLADGLAADATATFNLTIGTSGKIIKRILGSWTNNAEAGFDLSTTQLELGSVATEYEAYNGNTYNINFGSTGTIYGGTLNATTGMLTVTHIGVELGTLNWSKSSSGNKYYATVPQYKWDNITMICSNYAFDGMGNSSRGFYPTNGMFRYFYTGGSQHNYEVYFTADDISTAADFKTSMTDQRLVYPLAQPITHQLTPTEVRVLMGMNHVWADAGSIKSLEYRKNDHGEEYALKAFPTATTSGSIASFTDGADGVPVKDLVVNIVPKQSGTGDPSPSNVRAISGWTEANITRTGKNIFSFDTILEKYIYRATIVKIDENSFYLTGAIGYSDTPQLDVYSWAYTKRRIFFAKENTTITVSCKVHNYTANVNGYIRLCTQTGDISDAVTTLRAYTFNDVGDYDVTLTDTIPANTWCVLMMTPASLGSTIILTQETLVTDFQIEVGSTATTFEPYTANTYEVSFLSAGAVYGGTLDVTTGMLTVTYFCYQYDGTESFSKSSTALNGYYNGISTIVPHTGWPLMQSYSYKTLTNECSNMCIMTRDVNTYKNNYGYCFLDNGMNFSVDPAVFGSTIDSFKAKLADLYANGTPLSVCVKIKTPISYQLTPTDVKSLLANNNIWSDTGSVASCEYRADTKLYIEKLTTPDNDMIANANITSGSYFMVGNSLYLATANIANGGAIISGTNCTATNLAAALNAINS